MCRTDALGESVGRFSLSRYSLFSGALATDDPFISDTQSTYYTHHSPPTMRLGRVSLLSLGALVPLTSAYQAQQPLQVYLHPSPSDAASKAAPTLTADQAKAVLSHHLGESIGDFDEIPDDEGLWGHLLNMWGGEQKQIGGQKSRIVIIEGGVSPQEVLPSTLSQSPSFYMKEETTTRALLAPYLQRASSFLEDILASIPALTNKFKDAFDLAGSRESFI